jgi:eukaryotic-like serine/threonine-protein kinase
VDQVADYQFIRSLGVGAHGEHYLARPPQRLGLDVEYVAVKVWSAGVTTGSVEKAITELRHFAAAVGVRSEYLIKLFDAGQDGTVFFYSMEFFPLGSLATPQSPPNKTHALTAVADASRGAHALHEAGIVHRNIKPANIMLREGGGTLSDLGLAHVVSPGLTMTSIGRIDPIEFLDPGILGRRQRPSRASDIWSLGVTLHRVLTGAGVYGPLPENDPLYAIRTVLGEPPLLDSALSDDERALISACLDPDPQLRPCTALAVAEAIEKIAAIDPLRSHAI